MLVFERYVVRLAARLPILGMSCFVMFLGACLLAPRMGQGQGRIFTPTQVASGPPGWVGEPIVNGASYPVSARTSVVVRPYLLVVGSLDLLWQIAPGQIASGSASQAGGMTPVQSRKEVCSVTVQHNSNVQISLVDLLDPAVDSQAVSLSVLGYFENTGPYGDLNPHVPWFAEQNASVAASRMVTLSPATTGGRFNIHLERQITLRPTASTKPLPAFSYHSQGHLIVSAVW